MKLPDLPESLSARRMRSHFPPTVLALYDNNYGLFLIATSMLFFAAMSLSVKYLMETTGMSTLTLILVRMGITGMCCWAVLWGVQRDPHPILGPPDIRRLLLLRGLCGFSGLLCAYQAFRYLSVSDTVTIQFLQPTVTGLLGWLLLKEPFTLREALCPCAESCSSPDRRSSSATAGADTTRQSRRPSRPPLASSTTASSVQLGRSSASSSPVEHVSIIPPSWLTLDLSIRKIGKRANALHSIGYFSLGCIIASSL